MSYQFSTATSFSDETHLESFVESISASLPNEMRRNLEHLRDLDNASSELMEEWRERQDGCLTGVETTLLDFFRGEAANAIAEEEEEEEEEESDDDDSSDDDDDDDSSGGRRGNKRKRDSDGKSPEAKKVACAKCRAKKVRCDGNQSYCLLRKKKKKRKKAAPSPEASDDGVDDTEKNNDATKNQHSEGEERQKDDDDDNNQQGDTTPSPPKISPGEIAAHLQKRDPPTNEDIQTALHEHNPEYQTQRDEIADMYNELRQFSNERLSTANQLKSTVDMVLGRLNRDIEQFEKELGIDTAATNSATALAAANNAAGGVGTGSGMIGGHQNAPKVTGTSTHKKRGGNLSAAASAARATGSVPATAAAAASGSTANANTLRRSSSSAASAVPRQQTPSAPQQQQQQPYPTSTRGVVPPPPKSVKSTDLAAIQVDPDSPDWILAKILSHNKSAKIYTLSDEDVQSDQVYVIPDKRVAALKGTERNKWARGDEVYAVYPDTTSFYHATVSTPAYNGFVMVRFKDDWDANGVTHEKAVLMQHVMKVPPGAK